MKLRTAALLTAVTVIGGLGFTSVRDVDARGLRELVDLGLRAPQPSADGGWSLAEAGPAAAPSAESGPGLVATVESVSFTKQLLSYPVLDATGAQVGTTQWRVVRGTGNCCENHLGATKSGRLLDFGGAYINFSDDQGQTWKRVRPVEPLLGPEGTVVTAPGGDILGVTWDPYSGDRVLAFKMDGATGSWQYMYTALHSPFYDREWIAVIPGPHTIAGQTVPYMTVIRGGYPFKDIWYYSLDGLTYSIASNKVLTQLAGEAGVSEWLPTTPDPDADWTQPISESSVAPLNGGGALARRADALDGISVGPVGWTNWWMLKPGSLTWSRFRLGDGTELPSGRLAMDSRGWTHLVNAEEGKVMYGISKDGGRSWTSTTSALPAGFTVEDWDFRANGALGITSVAVHAHHGESDKDRDLVLRYATVCGQPELTRTHLVGNGDLNVGSGLGASIRFDFATTAVLSDGRIATSLIDAAHPSPALAVELGTTLTPGYTPPMLSCGVPAP